MIEYECNKKGCSSNFNIDRDDVIRAELDNKYIACPICGSRNIRKRINIEKLMEERSAVNI